MEFEDMKRNRLVSRAFNNAYLRQTGNRAVITRNILGAKIPDVKTADPKLFRNLSFLPRIGFNLVCGNRPTPIVMKDIETVNPLVLTRALLATSKEKPPIGKLLDKLPGLEFVNRLDIARRGVAQVRDFGKGK